MKRGELNEMSEAVRIGPVREIPPGSRKLYTIGDKEIAVFNLDGTFYAIDDRCPHRGASLSTGAWDGSIISCPWHSWQFDLKSGRRVDQPGSWLRQFEVRVKGDDLWIEAAAAENDDEWDGIYRYLVRYGALGWVEPFGTIERIDCVRKDRVLLQTPRGTEIGEVLAVFDGAERAAERRQPTGEVVRKLTPEDEQQAQRLASAPQAVLDDCRRLIVAEDRSMEVIDGEPLFDGRTVVLYYVGDPAADPSSLAERLSADHGVCITFQPMIDPPAPVGTGGCGSGGCGSGGCGK